MNRTELAAKIRVMAGRLLLDKGHVSAVDLLMAMGRLSKGDCERWRSCQVPHLDQVLPGSLRQHAFFIRELRAWPGRRTTGNPE